jgi:hypothetical protein
MMGNSEGILLLRGNLTEGGFPVRCIPFHNEHLIAMDRYRMIKNIPTAIKIIYRITAASRADGLTRSENN